MTASGKSGSSSPLRLECSDLLAKAVALGAFRADGALELSELLASLAGSRLGGVNRIIPKL